MFPQNATSLQREAAINNFVTKLDRSPKPKTNGQSPMVDVTYDVLPKAANENSFTEPCVPPARKRLRSREPDDMSSPGRCLYNQYTISESPRYCSVRKDKQKNQKRNITFKNFTRFFVRSKLCRSLVVYGRRVHA